MRACLRVPTSLILITALAGATAACTSGREPREASSSSEAAVARASRPGPSERGEIVLPDLLAIELPGAEATRIEPTDSPLRELLATATAGGFQVTHDLTHPIGTGTTDVTWTAWEGAPRQSAARATSTARIHVFPFGQVPVGLSGDDRATVGNQSPKVVRDTSGKAHMVWLDSDRPGRAPRVMYRRAAVDPRTGAVTWETEPLRVSDERSEAWNSYPVIEASPSAVHIAWAGERTVRYRRLVRAGDSWVFEPIRDTGLAGPGPDYAPGLGVRGEAEIHLLTPTGGYGLSTDAGRTWTADQVPIPHGTSMKGPALAVDAKGNAHIAFSGWVRAPAGGFTGYGKQHGAYSELRYVRRRAGGGWVDAQNPLAGYPEWRDPATREDVLVDFADIAVDGRGHIHVGWHGTANNRAYSYDEAFYLRRPATGPDTWGPWGPVQALHPLDPTRGHYFSFAPSLSVDDDSDVVLAVLFFDTVPRVGGRFDSAVRVLRGGEVEGPAIPLTRSARDAVASGNPQQPWSTWFPIAAPRVFRGADGRAWLDVLQTVVISWAPNAAHYIVYQRLEVTALVGDRRQ